MSKTGLEGCYVVDGNGCFIWQMASCKGYPYVRRNNKYQLAHRYSWSLANGRPIPDDMTVDHICFVPMCVNPDHLRLLSRSENSGRRRANDPLACPRGHAYTPENTEVYVDKRWPTAERRRCRTCVRERVRT